MRVLYLTSHYPQITETYVSGEIAFFQAAGVHVEIWAKNNLKPDVPMQCPVHRGSVAEAVAAANPDLIHMHHLVLVHCHDKNLPPDIPVTVRSHSFDWSRDAAARVTALPQVKRVYAFPHFARELPDPKVRSLPVAYRSSLHRPSAKDRNLVVRLAAALPTKGLRDLFQVSELCPDHRFVLCAAQAGGGTGYIDELRRMNKVGRVDIRVDVQVADAAQVLAPAAIYLETSDPRGHRFGMPISIAEAMATGALVLARKSPAAHEFVGDAGILYESPEEAARIIRESKSWNDARWNDVAQAAVRRATLYSDETVLPQVLSDWKTITGKV